MSPPKGYSGRAKKLGKCHYCSEWFAKSHLEVDHVNQAGSCKDWDSAQEFLRNLLDCNDNWVLACRPCHKVKSYAEREGINFEDALIDKKVIAFEKQGIDSITAFCTKYGYTKSQLSNGPKRREALKAIFKEHGIDV